MVRYFLTASVLVGAFALTGCGASATHVKPETAQATTEVRSAQIPGEVEFSFGDSRATKSHEDVGALPFRPNTQERPSKGAVHAATN